jgi:ech hydrogenase subunit A
MPWVLFLVLFPLALSAALLVLRDAKVRNAVVLAGCAVVAAASLGTVVVFGNGETRFFGPPAGWPVDSLVLGGEVLVTLVVLVASFRHRRVLAPVLALAQLAVSAGHALSGHATELALDRVFAFDRLSMVMVLVVGVLGTLICVYALGYMRDFHRHAPKLKGRRTSFFFLLFLFLAAMFLLVTANHLPLAYLAWEMTTVCSFLLIGYTGTQEATGHAFHALNVNLLGGLAFSVALVVLSGVPGGLDLARLSTMGGPVVLLAVALLALAGLTKSAQLPFSSWLLGAMYAPTPTSALLHSSTMVKAGVFLLVKLAPVMSGTVVGTGVALTGMLTFLFTALVNLTERNTKKLLAYSTIGNLGLIVGCAGIGTPTATWIAVVVILFHAVSKSLLFQVVGTLENRLYTKDMEHFDNLVSRMPRVSVLALTGMAGMFMAPFGIVVAKWAAVRAFLALPGLTGVLFLVIIAFGSAMTLFYWGKLLLKVVGVRQVSAQERSVEDRVTGFEWFSEVIHAVLVVVLSAGVAVLSRWVISPYALAASGSAGGDLLALDGLTVVILVLCVVSLPAAAWHLHRRGGANPGDIYLSGRNVDGAHVMDAGLSTRHPVTLRNYYLEDLISGPRVFLTGQLACGAVTAVTVVLALLGVA